MKRAINEVKLLVVSAMATKGAYYRVASIAIAIVLSLVFAGVAAAHPESGGGGGG